MIFRFGSSLVALPAAYLALVWFHAGAALAKPPLDLGLYRASDGAVLLDYNRDSVPDLRPKYLPAPQYVLSADMDGDSLADIVTYRDGVWTVDNNLDGVPDATYYFGGAPGDIPLLGDIDSNGKPDLVIYRAGSWIASLHRDGFADRIFTFGGKPGDIPLLTDVNCDGTAELVIYNGGIWFVDGNYDGIADVAAGLGGAPEDRPFAADWDGDCRDDIGVFRDGIWYVLRDSFGTPAISIVGYGRAGDTPLAGRFDRALTSAKFRSRAGRIGLFRPLDEGFMLRFDNETDPGLYLFRGMTGTAFAAPLGSGESDALVLYDAGTWYVDRDLDGVTDVVYDFGGMPGDVPLAGDIDGNGIADLVIFRNGLWYISTRRDGVADIVRGLGGALGDIPLLADMNGDGRADLGIYRDGMWLFDTTGDSIRDLVFQFGGAPGDVPLAGDWNGDGTADLIVYRSGEWYVNTTRVPGAVNDYAAFGAPSDTPIVGRFRLETSVTPVLFAPTGRPIYPLGTGLLPPTVADFDSDGRVEPLGGHNNAGNIEPMDLGTTGLASIYSPGRTNRDCRVADLNGDRIPDVICNTYSSLSESASYARLFFGLPAGGFAEDAAFAALGIRGYGETIVAADFDNDGDIDLFLPHYSHNSPGEHSYLLRNNGAGVFTDIADAAGVALRNVPAGHRVEGAQAVDFDGDGWLDFYVGGRLFRNDGNLTFTDITAAVGLSGEFDEGAKFLDWNNDGRLDLVLSDPTYGPSLWEFDGRKFHRRNVLPSYFNYNIFGINVADLNGDGREDIIVASGSLTTSYVALNSGQRFERNPVSMFDAMVIGQISVADLDGDGRLDLVFAPGGTQIVARNISPLQNPRTLTIEVVDAAGRRNQFGRVARIRPGVAAGVTMTRVVDGGSGFLSQTPYALTVPTPYPGTHDIAVRFASGTVHFPMLPGQRVRVYADGRTEAF